MLPGQRKDKRQIIIFVERKFNALYIKRRKTT